MTYIITPYDKAFEMLPGEVSFHCNEAIVDNKHIGYTIFVIHNNKIFTYPISPIFTYLDQDLNKCYIECGDSDNVEDNLNDCRFYAIEWLEDFLIRLSKNPHVIHCVSDGEIFVH